jgi:hypothetical protein
VSYPIGFEIVDVEPGKVPYVKATYLCEGIADANQRVRQTIATHSTGIDISYDLSTKILILCIGEQYPARDLRTWNSGQLVRDRLTTT